MCKPVLFILSIFVVIILWNLKKILTPIEVFHINFNSAIDNPKVSANLTAIEQSDSSVNSNEENLQAKTDTLMPQCESDSVIRKISENYESQLKALIDSFASSENVEDKLSYALYHELNEGENRLDLLLSFHTEHPKHKTMLHELMLQCSVNPTDKRCSYELIETILALDPNNDAIWTNAFMYFAAHRDTEKLEWAYDEALKVPYSTNYFVKNVVRHVDVLEAGGNSDYTQNLLLAIGTEAAKPVGWKHLLEYCVTSENHKNHSDLCLRIGSLMENTVSQYSDTMFARALQHKVYEILDNQEQIRNIEQRRQKDSFVYENHFRTMKYLFIDESLSREWLNQYKIFGEISAIEYLIDEVEIRTQDENYFPCLRQSS